MAELSKIIAMALAFAESGGGGGTSDYEDLENKPSINSITLVGNKTSMQLGLFQQLTTMPTAGVTYNGKVVQYTGTTNETYTANNFYKCVLEGASYVWVRVDVQPSGMTNPMTTAGDIIVGGTDGTPTKLGIGTSGQVLKVGDNGLEYADDENTDELSELTDVNISSPTNNQVLGYNSTTQKWENQDVSSGGSSYIELSGSSGTLTNEQYATLTASADNYIITAGNILRKQLETQTQLLYESFVISDNVGYIIITKATQAWALQSSTYVPTGTPFTNAVRAVIPQVKTTVDATLVVDTIYDLGEQSSLSLVLPTSSVGHCLQVNFVSGSTPTTLSVTSSAILSTFDLTPQTNKVYTLFFDWTMLDGSNYGWTISYEEFTKAE